MLRKLLLNNILIKTIHQVRITLLPHQNKKVLFLAISVFVLAIIELIGLALVLPVVNIALNPKIIQSNKFVHFVYENLNFSSYNSFSFLLFLIVILFFLIKNISSIYISYQQSFNSSVISGELGHELLKKYYKKDLNFFNGVNSVELLRNITYVPTEFTSFILMPLITFINEVLISSIIITAIAFYNFQIFGLLIITILPTFIIIFRLTRNKIVSNNLKRKKYALRLDKNSKDALNGFVDIELQDKQEHFLNEYMINQKVIAKSNATVFAINQSSNKSIELISIICIFLVLTIALLNNVDHAELLSLMTLFLVASYRMLPSLNRMILSLNNMKGRQYVFEILNNGGNNYKQKNKTEEEETYVQFKKEIVFENITFEYSTSNKSILTHINYRIKKGDTIGIIGESGSGKTTLINIFLGFLNPSSGYIKIDETEINKRNLKSFRNLIGYVQQNAYIFDGNVIDNIALGVDKNSIDITKIHSVLKLTKLSEYVNELPNGLNTKLGEHGAKMSGGQKQRLAIARALYHDAEILIFDEATSSLDYETEKDINDSIEMLVGLKTIIIVAHRYTTLKNCNTILELNNGKISRTLSYAELINKK